ncbi:MAG: MFS transporter [Methanomassiliicoccales archaeon]|nr:MFS transporter [Methanomassiliicoccales archaeon]
MDIERRYRRTVLIITSIGAMMAPLDSTIVSVSLPEISSSLGMDYASTIWIPTAYLVALAVLILSVGRLSDIRGRKPIFVSGFAIFVVGSFLCSIAQSGGELIAFRIIQGVGAAFFGATSTAIITDIFPRNERGKALGINAMSVYLGLTMGPPLGGFLTQALGWQSIFYINIPIGTLVIILAIRKMKESVSVPKKEEFDLAGLFAFSSGLILLLVGLTLGDFVGWTSTLIVVMLAFALVLFLSFLIIERRLGSRAMLDVNLILKNRLFAAANISALLNYTSYFGISFMISFYLQLVLSLSSFQAGLVLLVMPITMASLSPISGWMSDKIGSRALASGGMIIIGLGLLLMSTLTTASDIPHVAIGLLVMGIGMGVFSSPNTSAVMGSVQRSQLGVASGTLATMRFVGQASSLALMGAIVATVAGTSLLGALFSGSPPPSVADALFVQGMNYAFVVSAIIAFIGAGTSLARGPLAKDERASVD